MLFRLILLALAGIYYIAYNYITSSALGKAAPSGMHGLL